MIVIRNKADVKIEYPIETLSSKDKVIFFDIETTGFSRKYCNIYLIGCMYYAGEQLMYTQWLAENFNDEANVLMAFNKFIKDFDTIIHFNGNSFDIPFVKERGEKYMLDFNFEKYKQIDIYKSVNSINHILKMENQKQKTEKISELEFGIVPKTGSLFMTVYLIREVQQPVQLSTAAGAASYDMAKKISRK